MTLVIDWLLIIVLAASFVILATIIVRDFVLPWYKSRLEAEYDDILNDDLVKDDISIILSGTVTQKDLQNTIKILKQVSVAVKRTEQKATALEKLKQHQVKIEEGKQKIEQLTTEIKSASQQP